MMDFKQFSERINLMEYLSSLSDEELDRFIAFADGALLINRLDSKEEISKEVAEELICLEPWIFYLAQHLELEDKDLEEFKEIIMETKKIKKLLRRFQAM